MGYLSGILFFIALLAVFLVKIRFEETILLEEFGEEYARYKREVKALIPFVI
jgi:protein-S-isoprenylcysteine O-methyltransferase Ste14